MRVVPVIDVKGGRAVAANRGDRANYRPLVSLLATSADPVDVARGLLGLYPFPILYVADLDGIEGRGADLATQDRLVAAWPGELWIDDGTPGTLPRNPQIDTQKNAPTNESHVLHVLGSESVKSLQAYEAARAHTNLDAPLSLDFRGDDFIGPSELLAQPELWPERVIVMTLARVGSNEGPDLARLSDIVTRAKHSTIYAAGGVRHIEDLRALHDLGVSGALIASALHGGQLTSADLAEATRW